MKSVKIIFVMAAIALMCAVLCLIIILFAPQPDPELMGLGMAKDETAGEPEKEISDIEKLADEEVNRFREEYGMEISKEDMVKELQIREDYEKKYGKSYEMEEIFIIDLSVTDTEGDPGSEEYAQTIEKIQRYLELYNIDESRYASMTAAQELAALEVEYGPLPEEDGQSGQEGQQE